jgi:carbohydrate kinase (thermoresistant glucokinase family)
MVYVLMGVSGSGKTTVGKLLAEKLGLPFFDADDFHPASNIEKMRNNIPLNDEDRAPWLAAIARKIRQENTARGAVVACSALKKKYRKLLKDSSPAICFIFLTGDRELIGHRLLQRRGHYMPRDLLDSQFAALEAPDQALAVSVDKSPSEICDEIIERLKSESPCCA